MSTKSKLLKNDMEMLQASIHGLNALIIQAHDSQSYSDVTKYMKEKSDCEKLFEEKRKEHQLESAKGGKKSGTKPSLIAKTTGGAGAVNIRGNDANFRITPKTPTHEELLAMDANGGKKNVIPTLSNL